MAVHQVEEYYLHLSGLSLTGEQREEIEEILEDEGYSNYEFQDDGKTLVVDDVPSDAEGYALEERIEAVYS